MLVLTRRVGEKLIIGENVTVTILSVKGNQIRIVACPVIISPLAVLGFLNRGATHERQEI